jgi:hypothetical protein
MLHSHIDLYKYNEVAIATFLYRVIAPEGEILSFAPPKESIQRKGVSVAAASCAPRFCRGSVERASLPSYRRTASMPRPFGLIPTKPAVLSAANENKTMLHSHIDLYKK